MFNSIPVTKVPEIPFGYNNFDDGRYISGDRYFYVNDDRSVFKFCSNTPEIFGKGYFAERCYQSISTRWNEKHVSGSYVKKIIKKHYLGFSKGETTSGGLKYCRMNFYFDDDSIFFLEAETTETEENKNIRPCRAKSEAILDFAFVINIIDNSFPFRKYSAPFLKLECFCQ